MARGGAGFTVIRDKKLSHVVGNITHDAVVMNYFKAKSPIMTGVENRITFVQEEDKTPVVCAAGRIQALNMLLVLAVIAYSAVKHVE